MVACIIGKCIVHTISNHLNESEVRLYYEEVKFVKKKKKKKNDDVESDADDVLIKAVLIMFPI